MSYEPELDDPIARGLQDECEDCGGTVGECPCGYDDPDGLHDGQYD